MKIPSLILKQLYTFGSLENQAHGVQFGLKNRLSDAALTGVNEIRIDGEPLPLEDVLFDLGHGSEVSPSAVSPDNPVDCPLAKLMTVIWKRGAHDIRKHTLDISVETTP